MPADRFIREKFTKELSAARAFAKEYFERYPKDRYQTEVESWRHLQSGNIEFPMKRLREPNGPSKSWQERSWRRARLYKLGLKMEDHEKYFELPHWQEFRKQVLEAQKKKFGYNCCEQCGARPQVVTRETALHVHHLTYERLGEEMLEDVAIICRPCHEKEHGRDKDSKQKPDPRGYDR